NLLMRDDDVINRAEHQRLAVEIALLKAATFPRLRTVEEALSGAPRGAEATSAGRAAEGSGAPLDTFLERVQKARPLIAGYLANAKSALNDENISFIFNDAYSADAVTDARDALEAIARDVYGKPIAIAIETTAPVKEKPVKEDPVLKAFQKHL